tara:strand:+ start:6799 stop:8634 length:1836 start_codon:yes stop_codon:yes gene_type:complete
VSNQSETYSETITIGELFANNKFTIPEIQRDYAWEAKKEVSKLLLDMWKYYKVTDHKTSPQYFIGTIIVYSAGEKEQASQIMDGQQRITSLTSLMAAIKTLIEREARNADKKRRNELEDKAEEIEDTYLFDIVNKKPVPKLHPKSEDTIKTIKQMVQMDGKLPGEAFEDYSQSITKGKLYLALKWFYYEVLKLALEANPDDYISEIIEFYNTITRRIVVTLTTTTTIGMAFQMFVSVNGAGKPLNSFDLLRGLLVAKSHALGIDKEVGKELRLLSDNMRQIEKENNSDGKVRVCMTYWTEARHGRNIQGSDVPDVLDQEIREFTEFKQFEDMIKQLSYFSTTFYSLNTNREHDRLKIPGFMQHRRILGFSDSGSSSWNAQHMVIYTSMSMGHRHHEDIVAVMSAVEWASIRGGWSQIANTLENIYPEYARKAIEVEESIDDWYDDFVSALTDVLNNADINGFSHLEKEPVSESKATVLLHKVMKSNKDPGPRTRTNSCNACRCMPEGAPSPWNCRPEREDRGSISSLLGNWFLMRNIGDAKIKQFEALPTERIKQMLENANTGKEVGTLDEIKKKISNDESWAVSDIRKRTNELLMRVEEHWPKDFVRPKV